MEEPPLSTLHECQLQYFRHNVDAQHHSSTQHILGDDDPKENDSEQFMCARSICKLEKYMHVIFAVGIGLMLTACFLTSSLGGGAVVGPVLLTVSMLLILLGVCLVIHHCSTQNAAGVTDLLVDLIILDTTLTPVKHFQPPSTSEERVHTSKVTFSEVTETQQ